MVHDKETRLSFEDEDSFRTLRGPQDEHIRLVQRRLGCVIGVRGNELHVKGDAFAVDLAESTLRQLYQVVRKGQTIYASDVKRAVDILSSDRNASLETLWLDTVTLTSTKTRVAPKTPHQKTYVEAMRKFDIVFGVGPAGTGKTYLAMAMAVGALTRNEVKRIVLARPAVEAGEKLGFLPGDLAEKVNPYLRPLYDALNDMMDFDRARRLIEKGVVEVAPLAFMRGRTLNDSFVILDEAQNSTVEQMKMFLTRLGYNSRAVITGDVTQTDLEPGRQSGLKHAMHILEGVEGIAFCRFDERDVVRHPLIQKIILAYERAEGGREGRRPNGGAEPRAADEPSEEAP